MGRIDLMQNYSFFEVPEKEATNVIKALNRAKMERTQGSLFEIAGAGEENGKGRETVQMSAREVNDSAAKATNVHRAMKIRIENRKMLLQKTQVKQKKIRPSRAERGYSDARGPKKKDDWQEFF